MSTQELGQVAVFIDWDNLAISTAADLGGAAPDIRAIVQRAQRYGTIIVARAYSEWTASSDRLAIYRAGIEPVYAPTFRFEPDTANSVGKGKSLADPCMVADFVDTMHLLPNIGTYVLVTGDKDMIPVVRLAQVRGRRIIVIGPDYVAGVLREMADEFIPYRSLIDVSAPRPPEPPRRYGAHTGEDARRRAPERRPAAPTSALRPDKAAVSPLPANAAPAPVLLPTAPLRPRPAIEPTPEPKPTEIVEAPEPVEERAGEDLRSVYATIVDILRRRREEGRDRIRATNLKDSLMQRMPGFSERRYGFSKFKDLLTAAEKSGLVNVIIAGPVHWISLPEEAKPAVEQPAQPAAPAFVPEEVTPVPPVEPAAELALPPIEERRSDMIRFVYDLRDRSRWLTYTYVLTNLISYFGKSLPPSAAESQARSALNYLVQEGVLRVDKEPQEVEVSGARHRVRMCHINTEHPLVAEAVGDALKDEGQAEAAADEPGPVSPEPEGSPITSSVTIWPLPTFPAPPPETAPRSTIEAAEERGEEALGPGGKPEADRPHVYGPAGNGLNSTESAEPAPIAAETPAPIVATTEAEAPTTEAAAAEARDIETEQAAEGPSEVAHGLNQVYDALGQVIRQSAGAGKPMMSASSLRAKLVKGLGAFNERQLGFPRFRDFLLAAQDAGIIRVIIRGHVTWITAPEAASGGEAESAPTSDGEGAEPRPEAEDR